MTIVFQVFPFTAQQVKFTARTKCASCPKIRVALRFTPRQLFDKMIDQHKSKRGECNTMIKNTNAPQATVAVLALVIALGVANCAPTPPAEPPVDHSKSTIDRNNSPIDRSNPKYSTIYDAFSRYDTNSDNLLDRHEFSQFQLDPEVVALRERIPEASRTIPLLFEEIDEDGDERISLDEITVIAEGSIPKIDKTQ
jgi:hypothetical protein